MQFGAHFFPDVRSEQNRAAGCFREALALAEEADRLGFTHIRIVEHEFHDDAGYSPNPMLSLAAAARHTRRVRLLTGVILPCSTIPQKSPAAPPGSARPPRPPP